MSYGKPIKAISSVSISSLPALPSGTNRIGITIRTRRLLSTPYTDTTTPLGANASYTGSSRDTMISTSSPYEAYSTFIAIAVADVAGTLMIQESQDSSTWYTVRNQATQAITNPDGTTVHVAYIVHEVCSRYVRVAYRNGASAQSSFRLVSRLTT